MIIDHCECASTIKSDSGATRFANVPQVWMGGVTPRVGVGIKGGCCMISRQLHLFECNSRIIVYME